MHTCIHAGLGKPHTAEQQPASAKDLGVSAAVDGFESLDLIVALSPGSPSTATVQRELAFDRRGCSQAIDVTHLAFVQLVVKTEVAHRVAIESLVGEGAWQMVSVANLPARTTATLPIPAIVRVIRARLEDHVRRPPSAALLGRIEGICSCSCAFPKRR